MNAEHILFTEQSFIKVPYEQYRKQVRIAQKDLEKEIILLTKGINEICNDTKLKSEDIPKKIESIVCKIDSLESKMRFHQEQEEALIRICSSRLRHLDEALVATAHQGSPTTLWLNQRLDRCIADYLLREGYIGTFKSVCQLNHIQSFIHFDLFDEIKKVETSLLNHSCAESILWFQEAKKGSFKPSTSLEFDLRLQEYIELIRSGQTSHAIMYAKKNFGSYTQSNMKEIQIAMAMLAIPPFTRMEPYRSYYDMNRWCKLAKQFRSEIYSLYHLTESSLLMILLQAGISSLKTPMCYEQETKNVNCPICTPYLGALAKELPYSHRESSCMVCRISGSTMNENNPPMCLPNGYIYSFEALKGMAENNHGSITCPHTGYQCTLADLKKVFIV